MMSNKKTNYQETVRVGQQKPQPVLVPVPFVVKLK